MQERLLQLSSQAQAAFLSASNRVELEDMYRTYLGKKGELNTILQELPKLPTGDRSAMGRIANEVKKALLVLYEEQKKKLSEEHISTLEEKETIDITLPSPERTLGHFHPITQFKKEILDLFTYLGFQEFDAPFVETDAYNFELLNMPKNHPARDLWDTLYVVPNGQKYQPGELLLRTHTSNMQVRAMEEMKPPLRVMTFDRCFRYEMLDARHSHTFSQFEVLYVDTNVTMKTLKGLSDYFLKAIFGEKACSRFRPKYYPFVEPGVGVDALCVFCNGKGCKVCSNVGWFEIA
ncbi:MAG TPA: phenylalanine--tRNA ligase subunit alpha, partial [Patescibacteria group bacterium]|nr:phenylalanine--tRNA ligase subunit alpha [Patescibacteria group bacterium]